MYETITELLSDLADINISRIIVVIFSYLVLLFFALLFYTLTVFFTSTLANTRPFQKHNVLWTILLLFPIVIISRLLVSVINKYFVFALFYVGDKVQLVTNADIYDKLIIGSDPIEIGAILVYLVLGTGLFFATHYIMSKKVNIK